MCAIQVFRWVCVCVCVRESNLMWIFARISFPFWAQFSKSHRYQQTAQRQSRNIPRSIHLIYDTPKPINDFSLSQLDNKIAHQASIIAVQSVCRAATAADQMRCSRCAPQLIYLYAIGIIIIVVIISLFFQPIKLFVSCWLVKLARQYAYYLMEMTFFIGKETTKPIRKQTFSAHRCVCACVSSETFNNLFQSNIYW